MRRLLVIACLGVCLSAGLEAGAPKTWESLGNLTAGTPVEVVLNGRVEKGEFVSSSLESLTIRTRQGEQKFARPDVERVISRAHSKRVRNLLIGVGAGAAIGLVVDSSLGAYLRNESNPDGARALIWTLPIGGGGAIGAAFASYPVVYRR